MLALSFFQNKFKLLLTQLTSVKTSDNSVEFFQNELDKAQELSANVRTNPDIQEPPQEGSMASLQAH